MWRRTDEDYAKAEAQITHLSGATDSPLRYLAPVGLVKKLPSGRLRVRLSEGASTLPCLDRTDLFTNL